MAQEGQIYVLVNPSMPGQVKVGKTKSESAIRAAQLSAATGVPDQFEVVEVYKVLDVDAAEQLAHRILERTNGRPNDRREFFVGPADKVVEILNQALRRFVPSLDELPESWRTALQRARANQPMLAFAEFERAVQEARIQFHPDLAPEGVTEALGAHAACCCFMRRSASEPDLFSGPRIRHSITERTIEFLNLFQIDEPERRAINFMRGLN
jgi:hypothetical protein